MSATEALARGAKCRMNIDIWKGRPVVYRCYDASGRVIYVGATVDFYDRRQAHLRQSWWTAQVARVKVTFAPTQLDAARAERAAILDENPRWNIKFRRPEDQWTHDDYRDVIRALRQDRKKAFSEWGERYAANLTDRMRHRFDVGKQVAS